MKKIKLAIVSDLHCHPQKSSGNSTYLYSDRLRENIHPIESLSNLLGNEEVDFVLCPGDVTDKCDTQGFISGWNYLLELKELFKAKKVIATVGNHDVDSRAQQSSYSYTNVKGIKKNYPFENDANKVLESFFSTGYAIIEEEDIVFLVVDSCFYHHNNQESSKGKIESSTIYEIESKIKELREDKYKILLLHHHPLMHSRKGLGETDVLNNGTELVDMISKNNFDLIIHGHKHDPWLRYENNITILSSGSFSAMSNLQYTSDRNMFHIVELNERAKGRVRSWTHLPQSGWAVNFDSSCNLPPICGFGCNDIGGIIASANKLLNGTSNIDWESFENQITPVKYLTKEKLNELLDYLEQQRFSISIDRETNYPKKLIKIPEE